MSRPAATDSRVLIAETEEAEQGRVQVLSPCVGWWSDHPRPETPLIGGSSVGTVEILNRRFELVLPEGVSGVVAGELPEDRRTPVEYGGLLFELTPLEGARRGSSKGAAAGSRSSKSQVEAGSWAVLAPTDGVFYRRPSPDAAPFVEVGSRVHIGQPVGLVEAMKTFNQIIYGGPGAPDEAEVVEIRCGDAVEVRSGQVLIVVR